MAPLPALLSAAEARAQWLETAKREQKASMEALELDIGAARQEKSIAAQNTVRELLKKKEALMKEGRTLAGASALVEKAVTKARRAVDFGLDHWSAVHEDKLKLSDFARQMLGKDPKALEKLQKSCGGAELSLKDGSLQFVGDKAQIPKLQEALTALESNYEVRVEGDEVETIDFIQFRGEFDSIMKRLNVKVSREGPLTILVSGPPTDADKAADTLRGLFGGKEDIDCPTKLFGAAKKKAQEVEPETGALITVEKTGGWGGGGIIYVRGEEVSVQEATQMLREWLDEREGASSVFVNFAEDSAEWTAPIFNEFRNDLRMMGGKFGIAVKERNTAGELELRGPADKVAEAHKEFQMILGFYKKRQADAAKAAEAAAKAAEPEEEEDDEWGAAPVAEPTPGTWKS